MAKQIQKPDVRAALQQALAQGLMPLPEACRAIRGLFGLSQADLADEMGVSVKVVKSLESGNGNPRLSSLAKLAEFAGLKVRFVQPRMDVGLFDPRERHAEEDRMRAADAAAVDSGRQSARERDRQNAMFIGESSYRLPRLS